MSSERVEADADLLYSLCAILPSVAAKTRGIMLASLAPDAVVCHASPSHPLVPQTPLKCNAMQMPPL